MNLLGLALSHRLLSALAPRSEGEKYFYDQECRDLHLLAVRPGLGGAVGGGENLAGEGVRHLGPGLWLRLVVPELLLGAAGHLGYDELNLLLHQLALLPGDGLALLGPGPDLLPLVVRLPESDAV